MNLLIQFLLRLSFGLAVGMAITSSRKVTSGYFRNHLYVVLGLTTLAALVSYQVAPEILWYTVAAALASYIGAILWLYEKPRAGKIVLVMIALLCMEALFEQADGRQLKDAPSAEKYSLASVETAEPSESPEKLGESALSLQMAGVKGAVLGMVSSLTSGLLLGTTMAAMLLGHWYLNSPTMELVPLRRLILAIGVAVLLQMIVSALGLWGELTYAETYSTQWILFLVLRWSFGLVGVAALAWMAWETLKVPNTQSATGILYVAVIGTFVGETMALLLSAESMFPL